MSTHSHRTLTTDAEIAAYLHRLRMAILEALRGGPATASQIAARLGVHPANLTRHIRTLEDAGLITLVEKRDTGRNLEKYYEAAADSFDIAPEAKDLKSPHKIALAFARSDLSAALGRLSDKETRPVLALVAGARIASRDVERFRKAVARLVESFSATDGRGGESYHLNVCLYPGDADLSAKKRVHLRKRGGRG
jgi:DNA-binding transcriptional ArsR family regulator